MYKEINHEQNKQQQQQQITKPQTRNICYMFVLPQTPGTWSSLCLEQTPTKYRFHSSKTSNASVPMSPPQRALLSTLLKITPLSLHLLSVFIAIYCYLILLCLFAHLFITSISTLRAATLFCCHISALKQCLAHDAY